MKKLDISNDLLMKLAYKNCPQRCIEISKYFQYNTYEAAFDYIYNNYNSKAFSSLVDSFIKRISKDYGKENAKRIISLIKR